MKYPVIKDAFTSIPRRSTRMRNVVSAVVPTTAIPRVTIRRMPQTIQ
jgi:hypothetical protein